MLLRAKFGTTVWHCASSGEQKVAPKHVDGGGAKIVPEPDQRLNLIRHMDNGNL